jgi:GNAT superfamily N-acetyltransferase
MKIRIATSEDIPQLVKLRMNLFAESDAPGHAEDGEELVHVTTEFFKRSLGTDACKTWVAEIDGEIAAAGTLAVFVRPPYPGNLAGLEAYLLNMFTLPEHRKKGLARTMLDAIMTHAREQGYGKVWLHATDAGRPLYESIGFAPTPTYMERMLP